MPRAARIVIAGTPHHITQRGNNRQDVFFVDDDRVAYLGFLHMQAQRYGFTVWGYCLMHNHIHIVGTPRTEDALAKTVGRTHFLYTQYVNRLHGRSGHLWQNRFYSCAMAESHAWNALGYVELNPVRAKIVKRAWDYPWSSAAVHCGTKDDPLLDLSSWRAETSGPEWRATLRAMAKDTDLPGVIRRNTKTGRPLGSDSFLSKMEHLLGRRLRPLPVGRPKGWRKKKPAPARKRRTKM